MINGGRFGSRSSNGKLSVACGEHSIESAG